MSSWDFWDDFPLLTNMIESYRKDRDPAPLIGFIKLNPEAMRSPQIGRLFLDMLSGRLPKIKNRNKSTSVISERAVELVFFYVGQGLGRSNAYSQAARHLGYGDESSIRGFVKTWVKNHLSKKWNGAITLKEFWGNPEKYTGHIAAFFDGKKMVDDELARNAVLLAGYPDMPIKEYRQIITNIYEKGVQKDFGDPWDAAKNDWLDSLKGDQL